jgi:hypothetical protein
MMLKMRVFVSFLLLIFMGGCATYYEYAPIQSGPIKTISVNNISRNMNELFFVTKGDVTLSIRKYRLNRSVLPMFKLDKTFKMYWELEPDQTVGRNLKTKRWMELLPGNYEIFGEIIGHPKCKYVFGPSIGLGAMLFCVDANEKLLGRQLYKDWFKFFEVDDRKYTVATKNIKIQRLNDDQIIKSKTDASFDLIYVGTIGDTILFNFVDIDPLNGRHLSSRVIIHDLSKKLIDVHGYSLKIIGISGDKLKLSLIRSPDN